MIRATPSRPAVRAASARLVPPRRGPRSGLTLVEVLVALALFAVISAAGFSVLDQLIRVQSGTDGRLDHLAQIQRAMHIFSQDFMQASGGSLGLADGAVSFRRGAADGELSVRYALEGTDLVRGLSSSVAPAAARQVLLTGVDALEWRFLSEEDGWTDTWPVETEPDPLNPTPDPVNPAAVSLAVTLRGPGLAGTLRRVAILPAEVDE